MMLNSLTNASTVLFFCNSSLLSTHHPNTFSFETVVGYTNCKTFERGNGIPNGAGGMNVKVDAAGEEDLKVDATVIAEEE